MIDAPGGTYWQHWRTYIKAELVLNGMIDEDDLSLFKLTDSVDEAVAEIIGFYRRYHSMRWVGPLLMMRLKEALAPAALERLNDLHAAALLSEGRIEQHLAPLEGEGDEADYPQLPRLTLAFNHKSVAALRRLVNDINQ
jgi:hypothetical protein